MLGATRNICAFANDFEQLNQSTKTKCAEDRQVTSRQNMMTGGSFVDSTTQIDGQRTTTPGRYPRIHKTIGKTRSDIYNLVFQTEKTEQNSSKSLHLALCLEEKQKTNQQKAATTSESESRPSNKDVMQPSYTRAFGRISQASCRSDPHAPSGVCPGRRQTDLGLRRRDRWVTTGLANQLNVAQNVEKELPNFTTYLS